MMKDKKNKLFSEFNPATKQEWMEKITFDLKGTDFNKKLVWKNLNNIKIQPFYRDEDETLHLKTNRKTSSNIVNYRTIITNSDLKGNKQALIAIKEGITGLIFKIKKGFSVVNLLNKIDINNVYISFILETNEIEFVKEYLNLAKKNNVPSEKLNGFIDVKLISEYLTTGTLNASKFDVIQELIELTKNYPNFKTVTISGTAYLNSGANQTQEIAYTLNSMVFVIDKLTEMGIKLKSIFNNLHFHLAIGSEYFIEIAKFKAFNYLLYKIAAKYDIKKFSHVLTVETSVWSKSVTDAHTNLLRATTEAMSAILGNVDGILIDAYDNEFNESSDFSSRIAGNITTILKEESYFGKVENPVDGSYYIENITSELAAKALELFKFIEDKGCFYQCFEGELIQQQIAEIRQQKIKLISKRKSIMVGVNKYPNLMEKIASTLLFNGDKTNSSKILKPRRASLEIETIRRTTEELVEKTGKRPVVELISYGNLTMRKARAAFSYDFIGVSGYKIQPEKSYNSVINAAESSAKSDSDIVIICSSDEDYNKTVLSFVQTFRKLNSNKILLIAGAPANINELTKAGLDGCINLKSDIITTISNIQEKIQKTLKF
ncbi:methylmalonyl-CoA mutase family protein [Lutibacter sp.]|uniref:methylmalonyl-CoA mutase family protein n=1 Tax=Lutibacter sp. TaxID=1925666 RepID=UPI0025BD6C19|nr:methylmalonyl-CoA mutase family protein [Lutibacter sp.]MCF6180442.1 methylmalonyl-CoA mutase family protein [Lutibacter sp.]